MDETKHASHRDRMICQCIALGRLLSQNDRISKAEICDILKMRPFTLRRWLDCFSLVMDLRIEKGIVIIEEN